MHGEAGRHGQLVVLLTTVSSGLGAQVGLYADGSIFEKLLNQERRGNVGGGAAGVSA